MEDFEQINWAHFEKVQIRIGTIMSAEVFQGAYKPSYKLEIDFGQEIGIKKSSAQITVHYSPSELVGKQVAAVINFPKKQIGKFMSEVLVTGFPDENGDVILTVPDKKVPNGARLF
jgi:tRNA-binding protein